MGSLCPDVLVSGCASVQLCPRLSPVSPSPQMGPLFPLRDTGLHWGLYCQILGTPSDGSRGEKSC